MANALDLIKVILCNTSHPGNIGSAARAMKTMGLHNLLLVDPLVIPNDHSRALACNASDVIDQAIISHNLDEALNTAQLCIAMTGRKRQASSCLLTPKQIAPQIIASIAKQQQVAIVFGNEQNGLSIEQLEKCNRLVTIPGNPLYCSLNLAHAVQIMSYEIYSHYSPDLEHLIDTVQSADHHDRQHLLARIDQLLLSHTGYYQQHNRQQTLRRLQHILHKADLERTEIDLAHGILKSL